MEIKSRFRGCLLGGAIGDALGYPIEFFDEERIKRHYGDGGIRRFGSKAKVAFVSDDTQMTLFTAEGLLLARKRGETLKRSIYLSYLDWHKTQIENYSEGREGLMAIPELYSNRAPGMTCMGSLNSGIMGGVTFPINKSKGCGGVMRTSPIALYCYARGASIEGADELAAEAAAITHGHTLGHLPSYALNHIIYKLLEGEEIDRAVEIAIAATEERYAHDKEADLGILKLKKALSLALDPDVQDREAIKILGEGWVAEEALAVAVYCAVAHKDSFEDGVCAAVNHNGDSDSTGAITGNILGAYLGIDAIPDFYKDGVELRDTILDMSDKLLAD
jgi:ADP-ribosylglycohydrolase